MITVQQVRALGDPARAYNFEVTIPNVPGGGNGQVLKGRARTAVIPGEEVQTFEQNQQGHTIKHAGIKTYPRTIEVQFEESNNYDVKTMLERWLDLVADRRTMVHADSSVYKTTCLIQLLRNNKKVAKTIRLNGFFITTTPDVPLDATSNDSVKIGATFSYDWAEPV